jgi:alpha-beta hydrolase superfamily lysophospholipase
VKRFFLLALCIALIAGCASLHVEVSPTPAVQYPLLQKTDVNGVSTWAILPPSYNPQNATPWIVYNHGYGQTIASIVADPPQNSFVESLAAAGFVIVASDYRNLACWGNLNCVEDVANLQTLWQSQLNLSPRPFVIAESMGGIVTWNAISLGTLKPMAVVGIYPACNLAAMYKNRELAPSIQTAYSFTSQTEYSAATKGFDPMLAPPSTFIGFPIEMWASHSDQVVVRSLNEDPFAKAINAAGGNVTIYTSTGNHGDPSNFDAPKVISFFSALLP